MTLGLPDVASISLSRCPHGGDEEEVRNGETKLVFPTQGDLFQWFGELLQERTEYRCQLGSSSRAVGFELTSRGNYFCQIFIMEIVYLQHVLKP